MDEFKGLRALVVDDQQLFREAVSFELQMLGMSTVTVQDGEEAYAAAMSQSFDVILSDIRMPRWDGRKLLEELRRVRGQHPPLILMSGFADLTPEEAYHLGADAFIGKPVDADQLQEILTRLCTPLRQRWNRKPEKIAKGAVTREVADCREINPSFGLGRGGIFLELDPVLNGLKIGDHVEVSLSFTNGPLQTLRAVAQLAWKADKNNAKAAQGCGLHFLSIDAADRTPLLDLLEAKPLVSVIPMIKAA